MKTNLLTKSIIIVLVIAVVLGAFIRSATLLPSQPIAFNHQVHLEKVQGITCQDCHQFVDSQTFAGLPSKFVCFGCHSSETDQNDPDADASKPEFASLMAFANSDGDIPWHRVTTTGKDVFFSHRRHVTVGQIDCRKCHPQIPDSISPLRYGPIQMSMDACIACHNQENVTIDCIACHQ